MNAWSYSRLRLIEECPYAYKLMLDKAPKEEPGYLIVGQQAHEALERYVRACHEAGVPSDAGVIPEIVAGLKRCPEAMRGEVGGLLERFAATFVVDLMSPSLETRRAFTRTWRPTDWFGRDVRFRAVIDCQDEPTTGTVRIRDWKTGWKVPSRTEFEEDGQTLIYAFIASIEKPKAVEFVCEAWYVRTAFAHEAELTVDDLDGVREDLERRMAAADAVTDFSARPGEHCQRCLYRRSCAAYQVAVGRDVPDETPAIADLYHLLKARLKDVETALRTRIEAEGPLDVGDGKALGFQPQETWKITDVEAAVAGLLQSGIAKPDVWRALSLSKSEFEKLLRRADKKHLIEDGLRRWGQKSIRSVFRVHNIGGGAA